VSRIKDIWADVISVSVPAQVDTGKHSRDALTHRSS
jgi:hypothetical protein